MDKIREVVETLKKTSRLAAYIEQVSEDQGLGVEIEACGIRGNLSHAISILDAPVTSNAREGCGFVRTYPEDSWDTEDDLTHLVRCAGWIDGTDAQGRTLYHYSKETAAALIEAYAADRERKAREETAKKCAEAAYQAAYELGVSKEDRAYIERAIMGAAK